MTLSVTDTEGNVAVDTMTITVENPPPPPPSPAPAVPEPVVVPPTPVTPATPVVTPVEPNQNTAPVAKDIETGGICDSNTPAIITLVGTDADGDALTYSVVTQPTSGTVTVVSNTATYTNTSNCFEPGTDLPLGEIVFTYIVNDGMVNSAPATVNIVTAPV